MLHKAQRQNSVLYFAEKIMTITKIIDKSENCTILTYIRLMSVSRDLDTNGLKTPNVLDLAIIPTGERRRMQIL